MTVNQQVKEIIDYAERKIKRIANMEVSLYARPKEKISWFTWDQLCYVICMVIEVKLVDVKSNWRKSEVVLARHLIWYYGVTYKIGSLTWLGKKMDDNDHTSVLHAVRKIKGLLETGDEIVYAACEKIDRELEKLKPVTNPD